MDFTASAITVVSSVWTLTIHLKRLIEGIRESEQKIKDLEHKARSFATVIGRISDAYGVDGTVPDSTLLTPQQADIRRNIQEQLLSCEKKFKVYEDEVSKLLEDRNKGVFGKLKSTWMEKANSKLVVVEQSITKHESTLQSLIGLDHREELHETRKDVKTLLTAFTQMFDKIDYLACLQSGSSHENTSTRDHLRGQLERRNTDVTLVETAGEEPTAEEANSSQDENTKSLHHLSHLLLRILMDPASLDKGFINLPWGDYQNPFAMNLGGTSLLPGGMISQMSGAGANSMNTRTVSDGPQLRAASFSGRKSSLDYPIPLTLSKTQPAYSSEQTPMLSIPSNLTRKRSGSDLSKSSTLNPNSISDCVIPEKDVAKFDDNTKACQSSLKLLKVRTDREKGRNFLGVIGPNPDPAFDALLETDASLEERDENGKTPLLLAARAGNLDMVKKLLANGSDLHAIDDDKATILHIAISKTRWNVVEHLLEPSNPTQSISENRVDNLQINFGDKRERTPLHVCTASNCSEKDMARVATQLIAHNADVNAKDTNGLTPIYYAIRDGKETVIDLLLRKGASLDCLALRRPTITPRITKILESHLSGNAPPVSSPTIGQRRRSSTKSSKESKSSKSLFSRRDSGTKT